MNNGKQGKSTVDIECKVSNQNYKYFWNVNF